MNDLAQNLIEELQCETVFTIPILGGIPVSEAVVVTWIIMAVLVVVSFILTRNLKVDHISKRQAVAESIVTGLMKMVQGMVGEKGKAYVPYLTTVMLRVTVALALMSIILIEAAGIYHKGVKRWLHGFVEPVAIVTPINILEVVTKPLSLCMRLFGNVLGAFVIMELLKMILPVGLPVVFSLYFDIFDGLLQAYVFVFLTSLYIDEITE